MIFKVSSEYESLRHVEIPAQTKVLILEPTYFLLHSFEGIERYPNLEILIVKRRTITLDGLESCSKLRKINISSTDATSLEPLRNLNHLFYVSIKFNRGIYTLEPLANCKSMRVLMISNNSYVNSKIGSLIPVRGMRKLRVLGLNAHNISNLEPLRDLTQLEHLDLNFNYVSNLEPLSKLQRLQFLDIEYNNVRTLRGIEDLFRLKHLNIEGMRIPNESLIFVPSSVQTFTRRPYGTDEDTRGLVRTLKQERLRQILRKFYLTMIQRWWMYKFWHEEDSDGYTRACKYYCNKNVEYDNKLKAKTK